MPKKKQPRQAQSYDKIFKENLKKAFDELIPQLTGLRMENYEDLNPDFQRTIEQKTDYLFRVTNRDETYALQVEFQAKNDPDMLRRMLLYRSLIYHRENLTVRQVVFYVGKDALDMKNNLRQPSLSFNYRLIDMTRIPYRRFLRSNRPEMIILAVLANPGTASPELFVSDILRKLVSVTTQKSEWEKFSIQVEILSQIKNLQTTVNQQVTMLELPKIEELPSYKETYKRGIEKGMEKAILVMHRNGRSPQQIAADLSMTVEEINAVVEKAAKR